MKRLNFGCGNDIRKDWVNADFIKRTGIDVVHDFNKYPYPFRSNTFDYIECVEVLEHLNDSIETVRELHRILKPGGQVKITVPYYLSYHAWSNPEHKRAFNFQTFKYFIAGTSENKSHNLGITFSSGKIKMTTGGGKYVINHVMQPLLNLCPDLFERTFLRAVFHPDGITAVLTK